MKKTLRHTLPAFVLLAALLLQSCVRMVLPPLPRFSDSPTDAPISESPTEADFHYEGELRLSELSYQRPDTEAICAGFARAQALVAQGGTAEAIIDAYDEAYFGYLRFETMDTLAYIRYTLDLSDEFYHTEYLWCEEQSGSLYSARNACDRAISASALCAELERLYFGEGYFDSLRQSSGSLYSDESILALLQEETRLEDEYMALEANATVTLEGKELPLDEALASAYSADLYNRLCNAYYRKYAPLAGEIFIKLLRVRKQIAEKAGYESYAAFAYDYTYGRDYSPEQARLYTASVSEHLAPLQYLVSRNTDSRRCTEQELLQMLAQLSDSLGGEVKEAYDYMLAHELYDLSASANKMSGSYMIYLYEYEMPFVYVSPTGYSADILTFAHEFGHFTDAYINYNATDRIDCSEIFSQGMEFLALSRIGLSDFEATRFAKAKLADSLSVFLSQACYAEFEDLAYSLPEEELTPERLNALFEECCERFHLADDGFSDSGDPTWIDISHFFIAPYYIISYCISGDAALQIYRRELSDGDGFALYCELLENAPFCGISQLLEEAGMQSPFAEGRAEALAEFYLQSLT